MIVEVIPDIKTAKETQTYSYLVPKELEKDVCVGSIVNIPFGKKKLRGVVNAFLKEKKIAYKLKELTNIESNFLIPENYVSLAHWISEYYLCSLGESISLFMPPSISKPRKEISKVAKALSPLKKLSEEQELIYQDLKKDLSKKSKKPALIFGVTGSGKTEVYIKIIKDVIESGKQVIVLVPEIILTPQTIERLEEVFGEQVCLMHSGLTTSEKYYCYQQFSCGDKKIIVGPRSALFVPSKNLGLIIIDEEQEDAYKQDNSPRYNTIEVAEQIQKFSNCLMILGSATPRVESYYKAKTGKYDLHKIKSRYQQLLMPVAEVIDLKNEMRSKNYSPISEKMRNEIEKTLKNKKQVLLFLNRRGQSTFTSCRECGEIINCPNCDIPLISSSYGTENYLRCHHCDYKIPVPRVCPNCEGVKIKSFGSGVEKIETEIRSFFPKARVFRVDSETIKTKNDHEKLYKDLKEHKIDIVIGTQMLSKGFDIPGIDMVGIISADVGLHLPQFRSTEKTFRVVTQVSGRSGRTHNVGRTIIQTYWPDSWAIKFASMHDYKSFYEEEIKHRKEHNYPPFCHIVRIVSEDTNADRAKNQLAKVVSELEDAKISFIGPGMCFFQRLNKRYRYHIIIKIDKLPNKKISEIYHKHPYLIWDVDPNDML